jgi:SNF2 family DNA or RNA helicase
MGQFSVEKPVPPGSVLSGNQQRNVLVHKFVCRGTIEERIDALIESKRQMAEEILSGGGEINLTELGDGDLLDLVRLDLDAATKEAA